MDEEIGGRVGDEHSAVGTPLELVQIRIRSPIGASSVVKAVEVPAASSVGHSGLAAEERGTEDKPGCRGTRDGRHRRNRPGSGAHAGTRSTGAGG